jgi:hypothetical protein
MPEHYVRPPIVALERPSHRLAVWRFRLIVVLLLAAVAVGAFFIARAIVDSGENGNSQGGPAPHLSVATTA